MVLYGTAQNQYIINEFFETAKIFCNIILKIQRERETAVNN